MREHSNKHLLHLIATAQDVSRIAERKKDRCMQRAMRKIIRQARKALASRSQTLPVECG